MTNSKATVTVKQVRSHIRKNANMLVCLKALGLGKMNRERTLVDSPCVRGLIAKVAHLIKVIK
jgi:large subunit ribosomal protein L30